MKRFVLSVFLLFAGLSVFAQSYDDWNKEHGGKYSTVNKAEYPVYKDYIDFDKDGEYFGKEEVNKNE